MPALGFWGGVKLVFSLLPEIVAFVKQAIVWVNGAIDFIATKQRAAAMVKAVKLARETGDTSGLEDIFNPKPKP